ncbi:MAG: GNAT family N-acetyltransferase, partial [Bellilinea sp.]
CIRCREVRGDKVDIETLRLDDLVYPAAYAEEHFLHYLTPEGHIAGYLRLSLPQDGAPEVGLPDLTGAALIREVHVYGQSLPVGGGQEGAAQHAGLGTRLLVEAERIAREHGFERMAVIAAIGTRRYYQARGFEPGELYLVKTVP